MRKTTTGRVLILLAALFPPAAFSQKMPLQQVLQNVVNNYPSLKTAALQVERAHKEIIKVESQLSWQLGLQAGVRRDVSLFGSPTDIVSAGGSLTRRMSWGDELSLQADLSHEEADTSLLPILPNPVENGRLELNYRRHMARGARYPAFTQGKISAQAAVLQAQAQEAALRDDLAARVIELYMALSITNARMQNTQLAITRSERLQKYINSRTRLGVSEEKDVLQVDAQLRGRQAEYRGLQMVWEKQRSALNLLMGGRFSDALEPVIERNVQTPQDDFDKMIKELNQHSPALTGIEARLKFAESLIELKRDARKDTVDLVLFAGNRSQSGDTATGTVDNNEMVGGIRVEYQRGLSKSGQDADLYQAQLDRGAALNDQKLVLNDLQYILSGVLAELDSGIAAMAAYQSSVKSEAAKLKEAESRYRAGRTDTDQLIQFEAQLAAAELALELHQVELARRQETLNLLRGRLWKNIMFPDSGTQDMKAMP